MDGPTEKGAVTYKEREAERLRVRRQSPEFRAKEKDRDYLRSKDPDVRSKRSAAQRLRRQMALVERGWMPPEQVVAVQRVLASALDAAVRKGAGVHWDLLVTELIAAHDALPTQR